MTRRSIDGTELGAVALEPSLFGIEPNLAVLHQVVTAQLAAARSGTQSTKTRAEVRGGGAKPFRQKGTGRARAGSVPLADLGRRWRGPRAQAPLLRPEDPQEDDPLALRSALSDRAAQGRVAVVDAWTFEVPSTKAAIAALAALGASGRVLVVLGDEDGYADRSFGNLPEVQTIMAGELNAYDILVNDWLVFTDDTLPERVPPTPDPPTSRRPATVGRHRRRRKRVMRDPHNVLIRPVVSEKSYSLMDNNVYVFVVDPSATKIDVRHAVEQAFNVRVDKVNTLNRKGKTKRNRKSNSLGHRPDTKRAIVTLHEGDSIDLFEN